MKLVRYGEKGKEAPGILSARGDIHSLQSIVDDICPAFLSAGGLERLSSLDIDKLPVVAGDPRLGSPISSVGKIIAVGLNYAEHIRETGSKAGDEPVLFTKAVSSLSGPFDPIIRPKGASQVDWEAELVIVIGKEALYVEQDQALDYVAGYCAGIDVSERSFQKEHCGQWMKGKGCDSFAPIGPWLSTPDELDDIQSLDLSLMVNREIQQNSNTQHMIFGVAFLVSYISRFMSLQPGDLIFTGTPDGVGMGQSPQRFLNVGDRVELTIEGLGKQNHLVKDFT
ncbi:MAG: 2-hydroxyhepta-2,4-diene-1,7-dioate isomerase [Gammaproteobacteria bacterium]|nr:MAG: 2-hydroxyhepta-2,4-diene-1,7-dioate isomerase [Gammaproteobacteria bacterium]RLA23538.1 MAG: 2-hydroxyhepta-2,4-diene-1,7-dioate isomerase [Gammaproteobacteria bacterium]